MHWVIALIFVIIFWDFFKWVLLFSVGGIVVWIVKEIVNPSQPSTSGTTFYTPPYTPPAHPVRRSGSSSPKRKGRVVFAKEVNQVRNGKHVTIRPKKAKALRFYVDD